MEHSLLGYQTTLNQGGSASYEFDWTPPATNVGNIRSTSPATPASGAPVANNAHIYTATYTLTPAAASDRAGDLAKRSDQRRQFPAGIVPDSWVAIQGTNLASTTDTWANAIVNGQLPTMLDNVSVTMGGKPAYVYYISPTQINVLAPDVGKGSMQVTVTNAGVTSAAVTANSQSLGPAFFLWAGKYAVATRQDYTWAVANGTFPTVSTVPAKPGDVIMLWGTGFGPTNPAAPAGVQVPRQFLSDGQPGHGHGRRDSATVYGAALAPGFAGLYQVAIQIPASAPNGDLPVVATINGAQSPSTTLITIQK